MKSWQRWAKYSLVKHAAECADLTLEEQGLYDRAIGVVWLTQGPLPADKRRLRRVLRVSHEQFDRAWPRVSAFFQRRPTGWHLCWLEVTIQRARETYERQVQGGKATQRKRRQPAPTAPPRQPDLIPLHPAGGRDD